MFHKDVKNINVVNFGNKKILAKKWYDSQKIDVSFDKYDTKEGKKIIKEEAKYIYDVLLNDLDNKCVRMIPSAIVNVNYYSIVFDNMVSLPNGKMVNETDNFLEYEYGYNPFYYEKLVSELNKLARKDDLYIEFSLREDKLSDSYILTVSSLTKDQFEDIYDISLEQYYDALDGKTVKGETRKETQFRRKISELKKSYINYMIADINKGFDKSDIEMDGYISYLQVSYNFIDLPNKEEILKEYGFELDESNHTLRLKHDNNYSLELK